MSLYPNILGNVGTDFISAPKSCVGGYFFAPWAQNPGLTPPSLLHLPPFVLYCAIQIQDLLVQLQPAVPQKISERQPIRSLRTAIPPPEL